jgi:hypothetical protein
MPIVFAFKLRAQLYKYRRVHIAGIQDLDQCPCCKKHQAFAHDPWHYLSCPNVISNEGTARHNSISLFLTTSALNGGCFARYEPIFYWAIGTKQS